MFSISSTFESIHLDEFKALAKAEWGRVDFFEEQDGRKLPSPVLALRDNVLVGGLSFIYFPDPETQEAALWLNTLLVVSEARRMGVGSKLVLEAEKSALEAGMNELYVFTDVANLYQKLGWSFVGKSGDGSILNKKLSPTYSAALAAE